MRIRFGRESWRENESNVLLDWTEIRSEGLLMEALYLFACRLAWLRHADLKAYEELIRAARDSDPEMRHISS